MKRPKKSRAASKALAKGLLNEPQYSEQIPLVFWSIVTFVVLFLFFSPYSIAGPGLFYGFSEQFEGRIYSVIIWSCVCLVILAAYFFWRWRLRDGRDLLSMAIWLIPLSYLLSLLISAASHQYAMNMLLISVLYAAFFLIGCYLTQAQSGAKITQLAIVIAGYLIVLFGFLNLFGNTFYVNAVMYDTVLKGIRFTSVFQYSNAYAAFVMAILFSSLYLIATSRKWYSIVLHSLMLVPMLSSFWLTQTRGAYVLLPIILLLILPLLSCTKQLQLTVYLMIAALASFKLTDKFIAIGQPIAIKNEAEYTQTGAVSHFESLFSATSRSGWGRLILYSILIAAIVYVVQAYLIPRLEGKLARFETTRLSRFAFPLVLLLCGMIGAYLLLNSAGIRGLLPDTIQNRLENINLKQMSVEERGTFYKDAIKVVKDYPVFGAGGGAWAALYPKYESSPYISTQTHGFLLQYLVENGVLGLLLLLGFLGTLFYLYLQNYVFRKEIPANPPSLIFYMIAITLLAHSMIDFDLSYVYLAAILFLCLGGIASAIPFKPLKWPSWVRFNHFRWGFPTFVACIAVVTLIVTAIDLHADRIYNTAYTALHTQKSYDEVMTPLNEALALNPNQPEFVLSKVSLMLQGYRQSNQTDETYYNEANSLLQRLHKTEPFNRDVWDGLYALDVQKNRFAQALTIAKEAIVRFPWDQSTPPDKSTPDRPSFYERIVDLDYQLGTTAANDNSTYRNAYWTDAVNTYLEVERRYKQVQLLPAQEIQTYDYVVPPGILANIGQIDYSVGRYADAVALLKPAIKTDLSDPTDAAIARIYLASLRKTNQDDPALYTRLITADPTQKDLLAQMAG